MKDSFTGQSCVRDEGLEQLALAKHNGLSALIVRELGLLVLITKHFGAQGYLPFHPCQPTPGSQSLLKLCVPHVVGIIGMARLALPFLDAVSEPDEHGSRHQALLRPWKAYWPPEEGGELHRLLDQTCPEVLTWRFRSDRPFDKPWQKWSKQAMLMGKTCTSQVIPPNVAQRDAINHGNGQGDGGLAVGEHHCGSCRDRVTGSQTIDKVVTELGLRAVNPSQFNYLSPDALANSVKPFHTRLPFLGQIKRSNIVAQAYSDIKVFDIHEHEDKFILSTSGFQVVRVPRHCDQWTDGSVREVYLPAMSTWLQEFFRCRKVVIYTYTVGGSLHV